MEEFYLVLPSNGCQLTQPNNNSSQYIIDWQNELNLNGKWEAALTEFSYLYKPIRFLSNSKIIYKTKPWTLKSETYFRMRRKPKKKKKKEKEINEEVKLKDSDIEYFIGAAPPITGYNAKYDDNNKKFVIELKTPLDDRVELVFQSLEEAKLFGFNNQSGNYFQDRIESDNHIEESNIIVNQMYRFDLKIYQLEDIKVHEINLPEKEFDSIESMVKYLNPITSDIFKVFKLTKNATIKFEANENIIYVKFPLNFVNLLSLKEDYFITIFQKTYESNKKAVAHINRINQIYIYSSIIEPILVGSVKVPLLKAIAMNKKFKDGEMFTKTIFNPMYIPISSSNINNIEINIRDDFGRPLNFSNESKSSVTLHLRRKS